VRLDPRRRHPIVVSPLEPQSEPSGLGRLNAQLGWRWPTTGLLDVFKEADLRVGFTAAFATATSREAIDRDEVRRRLLLCLYCSAAIKVRQRVNQDERRRCAAP